MHSNSIYQRIAFNIQTQYTSVLYIRFIIYSLIKGRKLTYIVKYTVRNYTTWKQSGSKRLLSRTTYGNIDLRLLCCAKRLIYLSAMQWPQSKLILYHLQCDVIDYLHVHFSSLNSGERSLHQDGTATAPLAIHLIQHIKYSWPPL